MFQQLDAKRHLSALELVRYTARDMPVTRLEHAD